MNTIDLEPEELDAAIMEYLRQSALDDQAQGFPIGFVKFDVICVDFIGFAPYQITESLSRLKVTGKVHVHPNGNSWEYYPLHG